LDEKRSLILTCGGGLINNPYANARPINGEELIKSNEKKKIAAVALSLISQNTSIIIGFSTTVFELATQLYPRVA
jgi:DeoR family transcriptional regulator of aga operon